MYTKIQKLLIVIISQLRCFLTFAGQSFNILIVLRVAFRPEARKTIKKKKKLLMSDPAMWVQNTKRVLSVRLK